MVDYLTDPKFADVVAHYVAAWLKNSTIAKSRRLSGDIIARKLSICGRTKKAMPHLSRSAPGGSNHDL